MIIKTTEEYKLDIKVEGKAEVLVKRTKEEGIQN